MESARAESACAASTRTESTGAESARTASAGTESARTESAGTESARTASAGTEAARTESARTESARAESTPAASTRTESSRPARGHPATGHATSDLPPTGPPAPAPHLVPPLAPPHAPPDLPAPSQPELDAVLRAANVLLGVAARSVLDVEDEVTSPQLRVLVLIAANGSRTPGDVATALGVHASNATRACDKLVRAGLLDRTGDPTDRRSVRLVLTAAGSALVDRVIGRRRSALAEVLAAMPADERAATAAAFDAFARAAQGSPTANPAEDGRFTLLLPDSAARPEL